MPVSDVWQSEVPQRQNLLPHARTHTDTRPHTHTQPARTLARVRAHTHTNTPARTRKRVHAHTYTHQPALGVIWQVAVHYILFPHMQFALQGFSSSAETEQFPVLTLGNINPWGQ